MKLSREFIENGILNETYWDYFQGSDFDDNANEIIRLLLEEGFDSGYLIRAIRNLKKFCYQEARSNFRGGYGFANEIYSLRKVILSLLKGLIATSSISRLSEITDYKIRWQKYDDQQDRNDSQGHHNLVYREFKKVENLEELEKFNNYFHNYILNLVYGLSDTFIRRTRFTIDYFRDDKQFEASCRIAANNLEKFEKELAEAKAFMPESSDLVPRDDTPGTAGHGI